MSAQLDGIMKITKILDMPVSIWKRVGGRATTNIVRGADAGKDKNDDNFKGYTAEYSERKKRGKASPKGVSVSRQVSPPNLRLTSVMLNSIKAHKPTRTGVEIDFRDAMKVMGNAKEGRDIFGISPSNSNDITEIISEHLGKNISKYAKIPITVKIG